MSKIMYKILFSIFIISFIILGIEIYILGILPNKYLLTIISLIILILILITICFIKCKKTALKIIISIIEILLISVSIISCIYLQSTNNFFNKKYDIKTENDVYYLITEKKNNYKKIDDLNNKKIGIFMENDDSIKALNKKIDFKKEIINSVSNVANDINKIDAIFLNSSYYDLICEDNTSFKNNTKIIGKIVLENKKDLNNNNINITKEPFNILISGIDTGGPINYVARSDVNIVMTINPKTNEILLTHIPRDFYVKLHGIGNTKDKLTHAGIYGIDTSVKTVEDLLNIDIDYYFRVNFTTLKKVVDAIGGIDVYSDQNFGEYGYYFKKGINHLDGENALMFSRIRHVLNGGDRARGKHQEAVITAIFEKVTSSEVLLKNYNQLLESLSNSFQTNLSTKSMKQFIKYQLNGMYKWNINSISVDVESSKGSCYSLPGIQTYIMIPDESTVEKAHNNITDIINGKTFNQ